MQDFFTLQMVVESKHSTKCTIFCEKMWHTVIEQNRHYFWNCYPKISKKQVLDFIQQIWCRVVLIVQLKLNHQREHVLFFSFCHVLK